MRRGVIVGWLVVTLLATAGEVRRWQDPASRDFALTRVLAGDPSDWFANLILLAAAPLVWFGSARRQQSRSNARDTISEPAPARSRWIAWAGFLACGAVALQMSVAVSRSFRDDAGEAMPPAYHDEYSYLFQARTFLEGRTWFPSFERAELFDQMHVLNEGRFASRYFPGVGLWIAPFLALGNPWLGHHLAAALAAGFTFLVGRELDGPFAGLIAGLLMGVSPGLLIFSNLLLSHHPTLVGLGLFLWSFLVMQRTGRLRWATLSGTGLAYAMLCRPMTAAGFGLPLGLWFAWWIVSGKGQLPRVAFQKRLQFAAMMALPLITALTGLGLYNRSITGSALTSPYQRYTDIYTPRHVYGFNNVVRGEQRLGPKVIDKYDRWAENLDAELAARNVWQRLVWSWRWTLGIVPLVLAGVLFIAFPRPNPRCWLLPASILSLHLVHIPYWYVGIDYWHYVLETAPLWLLIFGGVSARFLQWCRGSSPAGLRSHDGWLGGWLWWGAFVAVNVTANLLPVTLSDRGPHPWMLWNSTLSQPIANLRFARVRYAAVRSSVDNIRDDRPAIVFVTPDPDDFSLDYVTNSPTLDDPVLFARRPQGEPLDKLAALFPERLVLTFDARTGQLEQPPLPPR